ncbi:MAG: carboxypeptidase-like regulatory domain-containing protein [Chloroflexi bacterium]|nr:carboxypeptidase-like regulatory domain-containing protein [Chloroflexota bacterium]
MRKRILILSFFFAAVAATIGIYRLQETRNLSGAVRDIETRAPIPDATLAIAGNSVTADEAGRYVVSIPRGKFPISVTAEGYLSAQVLIQGDELFKREFAVDFELALNQVNGVARDAETKTPLANAIVKFGEKNLSVNAGAFQTRGARRGTLFSVSAPGYQSAFSAFNGESEIEFLLVPNSVAITLSDAYSRAPLALAQVQFGGQITRSDKNGIAVLRRVTPGSAIRASATGYDPAAAIFSGSDVIISLRPNTLDGVVTDANSAQPINGALVYLGNQIATTNAQGIYHFDNAPPKATLTIKTPGYRKTQIEIANITRRDVKLAPFTVKAIHIPMGLTSERVRELIDLVNKTELNSIVLDVKSERGHLAWESQVSLAKQISAGSGRTFELSEVLDRCRAHNIYCIARVAVFQDALLATERPLFAMRYPNGRAYTENGIAAWMNPTNAEVWDYNLALAKEIAAMGFDEVQFDYIRFPGFAEGLYYGDRASEDARVAAIAGFLARAQKELRASGAFLSADMFGLTTATDDDQFTGQRLRDLGAYVDYVSPMVYPDTWVDASVLVTNGLGVRNCRDALQCPYDIIFNSFKRAAEKTNAKIRLWLQAYPGRGDYNLAQYKLQKKAAQDAGSLGWMFWNGQGNYDARMFGPPND